MSEAKHSPAPWRSSKSASEWIIDANGYNILDLVRSGIRVDDLSRSSERDISDEEMEANRLLVITSPELLAELVAALPVITATKNRAIQNADTQLNAGDLKRAAAWADDAENLLQQEGRISDLIKRASGKEAPDA